MPKEFLSYKLLWVLALFVFCAVLFEVLYIIYNGSAVPPPVIPRASQTLGHGPAVTYVVMGDSTAVGQGGDYSESYAVASANYLAQRHTVRWQNVAVSGARAKDVAASQLAQAAKLKPDVVLIAVGANDVTHLTRLSSVQNSLTYLITTLRAANPAVKIVLTGSPDMGAVPRFAQPVRWLAGKRTDQFNTMVAALAQQQRVTFAPIARETGPLFHTHPEFFAADKFHPSQKGYATWIPVIVQALDEALRN